MKRLLLLLLIVLFALSLGGFSDGGDTAEAGTVVIVGTDSNPGDGGSYYCGNPGTYGQTIWVLGGLYECQNHAHYNWAAYWSPSFNWVGGCGYTFWACPHYHCIWNC